MTDCATYRAQSGEGGSEGAQIKQAADRRRGKQDATRGWMRARNQSRKLPTTKWRLATRRSGRKGNQPPPGSGLSMFALGSFPTFADSQRPHPFPH